MPVWSDEGNPPGPLNYLQIEELIAFIRAPNDQDVHRSATRSCSSRSTTRSPARSRRSRAGSTRTTSRSRARRRTRPAGRTSSRRRARPSGSRPGGAGRLRRRRSGRDGRRHRRARRSRSRPTSVTAPADAPFVIALRQPGRRHPAQRRDQGRGRRRGRSRARSSRASATRDYQVPALAAGTYPFICTVHPNMTGTLTAE